MRLFVVAKRNDVNKTASSRSLAIINQFAHEQGIIPRRFTPDKLLNETTRPLGG